MWTNGHGEHSAHTKFLFSRIFTARPRAANSRIISLRFETIIHFQVRFDDHPRRPLTGKIKRNTESVQKPSEDPFSMKVRHCPPSPSPRKLTVPPRVGRNHETVHDSMTLRPRLFVPWLSLRRVPSVTARDSTAGRTGERRGGRRISRIEYTGCFRHRARTEKEVRLVAWKIAWRYNSKCSRFRDNRLCPWLWYARVELDGQ